MLNKLVTVALILAAVASAQDHCGQYLTCQTCVASPYCGWCSTDVVYPTGKTGPHCAGFNSNGSTPFVCNGIYSTEQCIAGYECDENNYECKKAQPGQGVSKLQCEANCTNNGQVYLCNHTSKQCYQVSPGTPGATSYGVCEASCIHPSSHPSSSSPSSPSPVTLYSCNFTTGTCDPAAAGKGSSKEVCEQTCSKDNGTKYICNTFLHKCEEAGPGVPGESKAECDKTCEPPKPTPGPPSNFPKGTYRGNEVSNGYKLGEFDLKVNDTAVVMVSIYAGQSPVTIYGEPYHLPNSEKVQLLIKLTSGPDAGKMIYTLADTNSQPGPETTFMAIAFGAAGGAAPTSISSAWTTTGQKVYALSECQSSAPECHFYLPEGNGVHAPRSVKKTGVKAVAKAVAPEVDPCMQWGQSCEVCLSHSYCGWCSTNVTYQDGTEGSQCAGFSKNGSTSPFICTGQYSTEKCIIGYTCDTTTFQCKQAAPGNGLPKEQCETLCRPTPPPTPPPQQYLCNVTLKQCFKCNSTYCPGGLPQGPCEAACVHPKHGPHARLIGIWRGIYIQAGYKRGEAEYQFDNTSVHVFHDGKFSYTANITSFGADAMSMDITAGEHKGFTFGSIYQFESVDGEYEMITYARGIFGQSFPDGYSQAMTTPGMATLVLAKCIGQPCNFAMLPVP